MLNNRGFTLIELITTIIILVSVIAIAIPSAISMVNKNKQKLKNRIEDSIIDAKNSYCDFNTCITGTQIDISKLIEVNLLEENMIDDYIDIFNCKIDENAEKLTENCFK